MWLEYVIDLLTGIAIGAVIVHLVVRAALRRTGRSVRDE